MCASMAHSIKKVCNEHPGWQAQVFEIDSNNFIESYAAADGYAYQIEGFPTLVIECNGEECMMIKGYQQKPAIEEHINRLLKS